MRHRTQGALVDPPLLRRGSLWSSCSESSWTYTTPVYGVAVGSIASMDDVVVPNFHERRKRGEVFFNPMYRFEGVYSTSGSGPFVKSTTGFTCDGAIKFHEAGWPDGLIGYVARQASGSASLPPEFGVWDASDISSLTSEAAASVLSQRGRSNVSTWETLAEMDKTMSTVRQSFSRIASIIGKASKKGSRRLSLSPDDLWLTIRYGVLPILGNVAEVLAALEESQGSRRETTRSTKSMTGTAHTNFTGGYGIYVVDVGIQTTDTVTARAMSLDDVRVNLASQLGLDLKGLLTLPWELISYSFVVDWFLNVGDVLGALVPDFQTTNLGSCVVVRRTRVNRVVPIGTSLTSLGYTVTAPAEGYAQSLIKETTRTPLPPVSLVIKSRFGFDRWTRVADAASLVAQKLKGPAVNATKVAFRRY